MSDPGRQHSVPTVHRFTIRHAALASQLAPSSATSTIPSGVFADFRRIRRRNERRVSVCGVLENRTEWDGRRCAAIRLCTQNLSTMLPNAIIQLRPTSSIVQSVRSASSHRRQLSTANVPVANADHPTPWRRSSVGYGSHTIVQQNNIHTTATTATTGVLVLVEWSTRLTVANHSTYVDAGVGWSYDEIWWISGIGGGLVADDDAAAATAATRRRISSSSGTATVDYQEFAEYRE